MTEFEKLCVDLYLSVHVSQFQELSNMKQAYWKYGQKTYEENTRKQK